MLLTASVFAQSPEKMSYQAVVRDASDQLVYSSTVGMQISILEGSITGPAVYEETHTPSTNANGLVSIEIGSGTVVSGDFTTIDWANGPYFIKTETDPTGGTNYTITGTSQLMSVPYALHAKNSDSWIKDVDTTYTFDNVGIGTNSALNPLSILNNTGSSAVRIDKLNSNTFHGISNTGFTIANSVEDFTVAAAMQFNTPTLMVNNEPTFTFFTPTGQGANRHYNFRINGSNRLTISGTGVVNVNSVLRLTPRATAPANPSQGDMYMDSTTNKLRVYDGTQWQDCW